MRVGMSGVDMSQARGGDTGPSGVVRQIVPDQIDRLRI